jgi:hypothetical protein
MRRAHCGGIGAVPPHYGVVAEAPANCVKVGRILP